MAEATLKDIMAFFGIGITQFGKEWKALTESDRNDIRSGITNGSLTY